MLRIRIVSHENETCEHLIEIAFTQVTKLQSIEFQINGSEIRMDNKLLNSNIAWYIRYELIHETFRLAYLAAKALIDRLLPEAKVRLLGRIASESCDKVLCHSTLSEIETQLTELEQVIYTINNGIDGRSLSDLQTFKHSVAPLYGMSLSAKGWSESQGLFHQCDWNLWYGQYVEFSDECFGWYGWHCRLCFFTNRFWNPKGYIVTGKIETVNAYGSYHSHENQDYCKENEIDLILGAI